MLFVFVRWLVCYAMICCFFVFRLLLLLIRPFDDFSACVFACVCVCVCNCSCVGLIVFLCLRCLFDAVCCMFGCLF